MGKKMKLPFLFKPTETPPSSSSSSWPWVTCGNPKTLSFRANNDMIFKTMNSAYSNTPDSESESFSSASEAIEETSGDSIETVIKGLRSERLFFEPGETSSILEEAKPDDDDDSLFKESVVMAMDSTDPFLDFRKSMEEMVEAHGLKDWDCLEELLTCYLKVNGQSNHGYIVGAFVDLLVNLAFASSAISKSSTTDDHCCSSTTQYSFTSPLSFYSSTSSSSTTPCLSSLVAEDDVIEKSVDNASSSLSLLSLLSDVSTSDA